MEEACCVDEDGDKEDFAEFSDFTSPERDRLCVVPLDFEELSEPDELPDFEELSEPDELSDFEELPWPRPFPLSLPGSPLAPDCA